MQPLLAQLLNLPGIEVENYSGLDSGLILEVEPITTQATCPRCEQIICHRWFREVTSYFDNRTTSAAVEGINNKLKLIKGSG